MRPSVRIPVHRPLSEPMGYGPAATAESSSDDNRFVDRPCYVFNRSLPGAYDDRHCTHCRLYLTSRCPHIDEFLEDVEDLAPE